MIEISLILFLIVVALVEVKTGMKRKDKKKPKYPVSARIQEKIKRIKEHRESVNPTNTMRYREED